MLKNREGQVRSGWVILLAFIIMLIAQGIFMVPGFLTFFITNAQNSLTSEVDFMSAMESYPWILVLIQGGGTVGGIVATLLLWRFLNKKTVKDLGFRGSLKDLSFGLLLGALSITIIFLLLLITGNITLLNSFSDPKFTTYTISFLIMFVLVGFFEEMFFRGYVVSTMVSRMNNKWIVYIGSSLLFSIVHGTNPNVSILGLLNIFLVGLLFVYMFEVTNSLWLPIGYHITWNYFQGNVFGFAVSGTTPHGIYNVEITKGSELLTGGTFGLEGGLLATVLIIVGFIATYLYTKKQHTKLHRLDELVG